MSWFRLEGRGAFHHKVLAAGNEAYGAWCRAGQWSSDQLTDGLVPLAVAEQIAKPKVWSKLVAAKLIHEAEGGYQIHDFLDFNPSSEEERARREVTREKRREAGKLGGKRSGEVRRGEADGKQPASNGEANAKQSASGLLEANAKQNEAPNPNPNPIPKREEDFVAGSLPGAEPEQMSLVPVEPKAPRRPRKKREPAPPTSPSPVTEVRDLWRAEWTAATMPEPAPWDAASASTAKAYLEAPGASLETARQAFVGMLRTTAGHWHRTHEGGRHATAQSALGGKHVVAFTGAGKTWLAEQEAATRPKREPPPPVEIPKIYMPAEPMSRAAMISFPRMPPNAEES